MVGLSWHRLLVCVAAILIALVMSGCSPMRPAPVLTTSFDPQAASFINASGRARISGQAFVRRNNGKLLRATGTDVFLVPRTAYADERFAALYGSGKKRLWIRGPETPPLYEQYTRKTIATSGGSFGFDHVADGDYYVVAMIHLPDDLLYLEFPIMERVTIAGGKSVKLVMRGY